MIANLRKALKAALVLIAAGSLATGCATAPFDETKPVQFRQGFFQAGFYQDGKYVDSFAARAAIEKVPAAQSSLKTADILGWTTIGLDLTGVALILTAPQNDNRGVTSSTQWAIGFALIVIALPVSFFIPSKMNDAADAYNNARFMVKPTSEFKLKLAPNAASLAYEF